ncbi:Metallo-beta-lactamase superfamily [Popillia japonica]|uniref:Zinc phosphodiesterase ELAC protein 2 n=1 Tax=Popillia japonica TaxID=7064 RepID=A0AAW1IST9_POPJA
MPKDPKHIPEAQKIRRKIKEKSSKYVPGRVTLQVLGTGAEGAPRSLYVFSDQSRYLFNCGEGTQRLAHEHKMKLGRLEHVFITQPTWKNMGGLPGAALTIQDVGVPHITLHGPPGLDELFVATKRFVVMKNLQITMADCQLGNKFEDNVMTVEYVPLERYETFGNTSKEKAMNQEESIITSTSSELSSEVNSLDKDIQAGSSIHTVDTGTSTRSTRRRNRSRRNSQSIGPYIPEDIIEDDTDYYAHELSGTRTAPERIAESSKLLLSKTKEKGIAMAYICRLQPRPGALSLEKCVEHGVPPGPLLGKLKNGEDITLESGVVVQSVDVREPDDPGPIFIVIDCPSPEYIISLIENEKFKRHQKYALQDSEMACVVVHFSPTSVTENIRYKHWMDEFSPSTSHLLLNDTNTCMGSISVHRIQYKLNLLSPDIFPLLGDKGSKVIDAEVNENCSKKMKTECESLETSMEATSSDMTLTSVQESSLSDCGCLSANTLVSFHLRPRKGLDRSGELKLIPSQYIDETKSIEGFKEALQDLRLNIFNKKLGLHYKSYPKVIFFGTGSCIPNKTRNTSGILFETSDTCKILLDCGEGTYGQLVRFYGPTKACEIIKQIKAIFISHLHADHHIGLIGFLQGRRKALNMTNSDDAPVYLFAPKQILNWLIFYDRCFENICNEFVIVPNSDLILEDENIAADEKARIFDTLNLNAVNTVLVRHCPNAFGICFTHNDGYKITYSGDTMPCPNLVKLGMNSDLLIHEATMEDELAGEAVIKMHSTTSQAVTAGKNMNAKFTLLTHFSQRYAKLPRFDENFAENIGIAFDNMQVRLSELPILPLLYPALRLMFAEHYEELENKAVKRQLRIERQRSVSRDRQQSNNHLVKV